MHSIPQDEDPSPSSSTPSASVSFAGEPSRPPEVEVLADLRGHVLAGRYVLIELLASGDLGCVYSGRDQSSGLPVTIKVLAAPEQRELVGRIAERARRRLGVRHRCVAAVLAEGTMSGLWYGVMEHAPGKNLYHADGDPRFEGASLLALAAELAEGLSTLHALGAPHGAISPGNLVWSDAGVKLVDLDVHAHTQVSEGTGSDGPGAADDVAALAGVVHELIGGGETEAPWAAAVARVARGEVRPSAAEWANQLRTAEIDALRPQVVAAATQGEGVIDSAWDELFAETDAMLAPASGPAVVDSGVRRIEPPPQLAALSWEVEPEAPVKRVRLVEAAAPPTPPPRPNTLTASVTEAAPILTTSTTTPAARVERSWTRAPDRNHIRLGLGLLAIAVVCALLGWRLKTWATADEVERVPAPPVAAEPTATSEKHSNLSAETPTLARVASAEPGPPAADAVDGESDVIELEAADADSDASEAGQLSAAEFRKILLRTNRSQRARTCYQRHGGGDVDVVALVGRGGRVQKLRMDDSPLADCLRKIVVRLEFPPAERQAQHNFVFHPPADAG